MFRGNSVVGARTDEFPQDYDGKAFANSTALGFLVQHYLQHQNQPRLHYAHRWTRIEVSVECVCVENVMQWVTHYEWSRICTRTKKKGPQESCKQNRTAKKTLDLDTFAHCTDTNSQTRERQTANGTNGDCVPCKPAMPWRLATSPSQRWLTKCAHAQTNARTQASKHARKKQQSQSAFAPETIRVWEGSGWRGVGDFWSSTHATEQHKQHKTRHDATTLCGLVHDCMHTEKSSCERQQHVRQRQKRTAYGSNFYQNLSALSIDKVVFTECQSMRDSRCLCELYKCVASRQRETDAVCMKNRCGRDGFTVVVHTRAAA